MLGIAQEEYKASAVLSLASSAASGANTTHFTLTQLDKRQLSAADRTSDRAADRTSDRAADRTSDRAADRTSDHATDRERDLEVPVFVAAMSVPEYRRAKSFFVNPARFAAFARRRPLDDRVRQRLLAQLRDSRQIAQLVSPLYSRTRQETREIGESKLDRSEPLVYALRITFNAETPAAALNGVTAFSEYIQDSLLRDAIQTYVITQATVARSFKQSADYQSLVRHFQIEQLEARLRDLQDVLRRYPASARLDFRQVVSVQHGSDRFLSPLAQIVGTESQISDARRELERLARLSRQAEATVQFLAAAETLATQEDLPATAIVDRLIERLQAELADRQARDEAIRAALLALLTLFTELRSIHVDHIRLLAEPSLPEQPEAPTRAHFGLAGLLIGLFIAFLVQFARRRWFNANKEATSASTSPV
ncbi:MAG: hypothetical protein N2483_01260 [Burkholderiaceae bacterium]|nr:hypothetical protein [Burkholderiaceae bacterium]